MVRKAQPVDGGRKKQADVQGDEGIKASVKADALVILGFLVDHQAEWRPEVQLLTKQSIRVKVEMDDD
jgi:hypothetical protein